MLRGTDAMRNKSARHLWDSRWLSASVVLAMLCFDPAVSVADVLWNWSFSTESGTFITTGNFAQTAGPAVFTFKQFSVSASQIASNVGASYDIGRMQPIETMSWNGSQPTQFTRGNGMFTNGSDFYNDATGYFYTLGVPPVGLLLDNHEVEVTMGTLSIAPVSDVTPPVSPFPAPVSSTGGIVCLIAVMLLIGALGLRRRDELRLPIRQVPGPSPD